MAGGRIFISYRRGLDNNSAGRIYDALADHFGADKLFMDVDTIPPGVDFVDYITRQIEECDAFIAVIGPGWHNQAHRLQSDEDFVRLELSAGLAQRGIRFIPVLVSGAAMPGRQDLPGDLQPMMRRAGVVLEHHTFTASIDELARDLGHALRGTTAAQRRATFASIPAPSTVPPKSQPFFRLQIGRWVLSLGTLATAVLAFALVMPFGDLDGPGDATMMPGPSMGGGSDITADLGPLSTTAPRIDLGPARETVIPKGDTGHALVLVDAGADSLGVIRQVKKRTGLALLSAKDLVNAAPQIVLTGMTLAEARGAKRALANVGALSKVVDLSRQGARAHVVEVELAPAGADPAPGLARKIAGEIGVPASVLEATLADAKGPVLVTTDKAEAEAAVAKLKSAGVPAVSTRALNMRVLPLLD